MPLRTNTYTASVVWLCRDAPTSAIVPEMATESLSGMLADRLHLHKSRSERLPGYL